MEKNNDIIKKPSRTWCMTINNYTQEDWDKVTNLEGINLLTMGEEIGENGTPHLQITITFKKPCRWAAIKKIFNNAHIECAISPDWAHNYCIKDGKYIIIDNRTQGKRNDIIKATDIIINNKKSGYKEAAKECPEVFIKFHKGLKELENITHYDNERNFKPIVTWIYGPTGVGKTKSVTDNEPELWISGKNLKWWQGYKQQKATLFDDFRKDFCTFHELLRLLDRTNMDVEIKGSSIPLCSYSMYITSPYPPEVMYDTREDIKQLIRRIDYIIEINDKGEKIYKKPTHNNENNIKNDDVTCNRNVSGGEVILDSPLTNVTNLVTTIQNNNDAIDDIEFNNAKKFFIKNFKEDINYYANAYVLDKMKQFNITMKDILEFKE